MYAYTNASIFTGEKIVQQQAVLVEEDIIRGLVPEKEIPADYAIRDLGGYLLAPAFIDLQLYGGHGQLFSQNLSVEALEATYQYCLAGGCTRFMITLATNTIDTFVRGLEVARTYQERGGKGLLGVHLEGPYINPLKKGAHLAHCIHTPTVEAVSGLLEKGQGIFKMMTLAPEQCSEAIIQLLRDNNILLSAGHSNASYAQAMAGFDNGIAMATHLFNAMSPLQHRAPGLVGAVFNHSSAQSSIVCDGIHVDFAAVQIAQKIMGDRLFFITDAVTGITGGDYEHVLNGDHYTLPDGTLSGSALTMLQCVRNGVHQVGLSLEESLRMASLYPARLLPDQQLGKIEKSYEAEFVLLDEHLELQPIEETPTA